MIHKGWVSVFLLITSLESDRLVISLWADFGSRIAISEKNIRMDCLYMMIMHYLIISLQCVRVPISYSLDKLKIMSKLELLKQITTKPQLAALLGVKAQFLTHVLYKIKPSTQYTQFSIPKKSGGTRLEPSSHHPTN